MFGLSWWEKFENSIVFELLIIGFFLIFFFFELWHIDLSKPGGENSPHIVSWRDSSLATVPSMLS